MQGLAKTRSAWIDFINADVSETDLVLSGIKEVLGVKWLQWSRID